MAVESWNCHQCTFRHEYAAHRCKMCNVLRMAATTSASAAAAASSNQPMLMRHEVIENGSGNGIITPPTVKHRNYERRPQQQEAAAADIAMTTTNSHPFSQSFHNNGANRMMNHQNYNENLQQQQQQQQHLHHRQQFQQRQPQGAGGGISTPSRMPRVVVNNPYSTTNKQSSAGIVNNPYKKSTQQQKHQQQHSRVENGINRQQSHQLQFPQYPQQQHQHQYNLLPTQGNPTSMGNYRPGSSNNAASSHNEVVRHRKQLQMTSVRPSSSAPNSLPGQRNASSSSTSTTGNYRQASLPFKEVFEPGPVPICASTQHNWIYPLDENYPERIYQLEMSYASIMQNTLVSLPTGLGKTMIAAVVMYNYYRWFPTGKVVFCAPTRPLVSQQIHACYKIMGIPEKHTAEISGKSKPESRDAMWRNKRVFFCTAETLVKDIEEGRCEARNIVCIVLDEAHKATGAYAYSVLVRLIEESDAKYRLLGLSATPGTDIKSIQSVVNTLRISRIEARTETDPVVKQYIHHREEEIIVITQPDIVKSLDKQFSELISPILCRLREENVSQRLLYDSANLKPYAVTQACHDYIARTNDHRLSGQFYSLRDLVNARLNLKAHGVKMARSNLIDASGKHYMNFVSRQSAFQSLVHDLGVACGIRDDEASGNPTSGSYKNNPKFIKLVEVLVEHFERKKAVGESSRAIVFSGLRDSVSEINEMLESQRNILLKPAKFIGQSTKKGKKPSSASGQDALPGMNQAQQQNVLKQFREGVYNILVSTSVAEEGLDLGEVDLVVHFDVIKSAIRSIQRNGRTGRKRNGRAVLLVSAQEEKSYQQSVMNSNKIARALKDPSVFKLSRSIPMFQVEPVLLRKKMIVSAFHLSQVSGHTPKARSRNVGEKTRRVRSTAVEIQWRLEPNDETERLTNFGQLPRSSCLDFERRRSEFPPSLKRRYINMRNQSLYSEHRASNAGRSSRIVRLVEKLHAIADGKVPNVADDAQDVSESTRGNTTNQTECLDFEDDCRSFSFDTDQPTFDCRKSMSVDADRDHANINLDAIFGPLNRVSPAGSDISKIAHLFHAHNNCRVVAPPGMALDESDEETATSALSEMSTTDDLCAFFDKTNNVDLGSSPKVFFSELNPLNSNGEVDSCSDRLSDVGASYEIDAHSADDEVVTGNEAETISKLKTTRKPAGNNKEETEVGMSCNQCAEMNGSIFTSAVESIGTETSQSPASEDNRSSSNATTHYEPREFSQEKCTEEYVQNQSNWNGMMSFRLPTPPPSSDDSDDSSNSSLPPITESLEIDDNICEEAISNKGEEAISNKREFFFQLPTQDSSSSSSSSEEEDGDNEAGSIDDQNEKSTERPLLGCNNPETTNCNPPLFEVTNTIAAIAHENSHDGIARLTTSDHCSAHNTILSPCHTQFQSASSSTMSVPDSLTDTPIRTNEPESKPTTRTDDLSDTPLQNRQCTGQQRASLDSLTDTPLEQHKNAGKVRKRLKVAPVTVQMTQPLQNLQCTEQRLQSFDSLTDTPLEQRKTTGNLRKRLKVAPETDLTNQPVALLQSQHHTDHNRNSLDSLSDTPLEQHKTVGKLRKRLRVAPGRDRTNDMDKVRKKMEQKYRCKFLDIEAYDESENSDDEEDIIQQIEDEEMSHDSFINDSSQLGYTQDDLDRVNADSHTDKCDLGETYHHRQINHQKDMSDFWKTPVFNRRMLKATTSESQDSEPSQKGLGNMNFIRSVLDHHRAGGDADEIEEEYHQLAGGNSSQIDSPIQSNNHSGLHGPSAIAANTHIDSSIQVGLELQQNKVRPVFPPSEDVVQPPPPTMAASNVAYTNPTTAVVLTAEQRAMIETKRQEALRRRQLRMQQQATAATTTTTISAPSNPYAK